MDIDKELNFNDKQRTLILMPLLFGGFIALLNETLLNVAFPQLMSTFNISTSTVQWLGTAYMLVIGILVPVVAFLLKSYPTKTLYLTAMILFTAGTIFCSISQSFSVLLISRMIQGAGTGMLIPIMTNTILEIYPLAKRGTAIGISMMVVVVAPGDRADAFRHYFAIFELALAVLHNFTFRNSRNDFRHDNSEKRYNYNQAQNRHSVSPTIIHRFWWFNFWNLFDRNKRLFERNGIDLTFVWNRWTCFVFNSSTHLKTADA